MRVYQLDDELLLGGGTATQWCVNIFDDPLVQVTVMDYSSHERSRAKPGAIEPRFIVVTDIEIEPESYYYDNFQISFWDHCPYFLVDDNKLSVQDWINENENEFINEILHILNENKSAIEITCKRLEDNYVQKNDKAS